MVLCLMICDVLTPDQCYTGGGGEAEDGAVQAWQVQWHSAVSSHQPRHEATCSEDSNQEGGREGLEKLGAAQNDI